MNKTTDLTMLQERLARLERSQRFLRACGTLAAAALAGVLFLGWGGQAAGQSATGRVLDAGGVIVRDAAGRQRIGLTVTSDGPSLQFFDEGSTRRAAVGLAQRDPFVVLYDAGGRARVSVSIDDDTPTLAIYDDSGTRRTAITQVGDGSGIEFYDSRGRRRVGLLTTGEIPALALSDAGGVTRAGIGVGPDGPELEMYDTTGNRRLLVGAAEKRGPGLVLFDADALPRVGLGVSLAGPALMMSDERIRPRMQIEVAKGGPRVALLGPEGTPHAMLSATPEDGTGLTVADPNAR